MKNQAFCARLPVRAIRTYFKNSFISPTQWLNKCLAQLGTLAGASWLQGYGVHCAFGVDNGILLKEGPSFWRNKPFLRHDAAFGRCPLLGPRR